jgi:hypothetical protein
MFANHNDDEVMTAAIMVLNLGTRLCNKLRLNSNPQCLLVILCSNKWSFGHLSCSSNNSERTDCV